MYKSNIATAANRAKARAESLRDAEARNLALELDRLPMAEIGDDEFVTRSVMLTLQIDARAEQVN